MCRWKFAWSGTSRRERTVSDEIDAQDGGAAAAAQFQGRFSKITVVRVKGSPAPTPESAMGAPVPAGCAGRQSPKEMRGEE